jgi:hypothetical protein
MTVTVTVDSPGITRGDTVSIGGESYRVVDVVNSTYLVIGRIRWWHRLYWRIVLWMGTWDRKFAERYADRWGD